MTMALGVFDSGVGGLTVVKEIKKRFPNKKIVYLGDTARVPYGPRGKDVVTEFAKQDVEFLLRQNVSQIVIACNTVSALAGEELKKMYQVPIVDVILPAARLAKEETKNKKVAVIGTRGTINSHAYKNALEDVEVFEQACPLFVPFIEEGEWEGELVTSLANRYLGFVRETNADTLILGCTHYPVIESIIQNIVGPDVKLIHCGRAVIDNLKGDYEDGEDVYYFTDTNNRGIEIAERILGKRIQIKQTSL